MGTMHGFNNGIQRNQLSEENMRLCNGGSGDSGDNSVRGFITGGKLARHLVLSFEDGLAESAEISFLSTEFTIR